MACVCNARVGTWGEGIRSSPRARSLSRGARRCSLCTSETRIPTRRAASEAWRSRFRRDERRPRAPHIHTPLSPSLPRGASRQMAAPSLHPPSTIHFVGTARLSCLGCAPRDSSADRVCAPQGFAPPLDVSLTSLPPHAFAAAPRRASPRLDTPHHASACRALPRIDAPRSGRRNSCSNRRGSSRAR